MPPLLYHRPILYLQITCVVVWAQYQLSTPNSNDCIGAGADYVTITNEDGCADAHDDLNAQSLVPVPGYKGAVFDSAALLGCILSGGEVFFNYDPIGSITVNGDTPICKYLGRPFVTMQFSALESYEIMPQSATFQSIRRPLIVV